MSTCIRCGQDHRTYPGWDTPEGYVGAPCWTGPHPDPPEGPEYRPLRDVLGESYASVRAYAEHLEGLGEQVTEDEAHFLRLFRTPMVHEELELTVHDMIAQAAGFNPSDSLIEGNWLGEEKERVEVRVRVTRINGPFTGEYGDSYLCVMETVPGGELCIWWTGDNLAFDVDVEYDIRGTVKKQDVYGNRKQTQLTRVKEVKK